jgi:hypothetical protein
MVVGERETVREKGIVVLEKEKDEQEESSEGKSELVRSFLLGRTG